MNPTLKKLAEFGQSIWYDNISRGLINSGGLQALIDEGVVGVTSNPTIFHKAIAETNEYDGQIRELAAAGQSVEEIYDALTQADIGRAADLFLPVYRRTEGLDGYVSLEVSPHLAHDAAGTIAETRRLFNSLNRPNVMIKIPGTPEGLKAIEAALAEGINVNVTLIFSVDAYRQIMQAFRRGAERFAAGGGDLSKLASVASFFVSRVDTEVDKRLADHPDGKDLLGTAAVANSKLAYQAYEEEFSKSEYRALLDRGMRPQRPLWASTSTKNPAYSPIIYVETLVGRPTVNTVPPATLDAIKAGFEVRESITQAVNEARRIVERLGALGISLEDVTAKLLAAGVKSFADSYDRLLAAIQTKRAALR